MKSKTKKRLIAFMLCMVLVLSSAISAFADDLDTQAQDQTTTMADEPVATSMDDSTDEQQPVAEAEENQEQAVETQEEQQTEENVSEEPTTEDSSAVAEQEAIEKESDVSIQTTVNGTTITMSGPHSSFPEGTTYEISASELNEDETKDVEIALKKKEDETNTKIATYKAYDIKLLVDGIETQPTGDVNVKFEGGEVKENLTNAENVEVYHVDESNQTANDISGITAEDTVTMTTNHFSTYVITTTKDGGVDITVQHYLQNTTTPLYRDSTVHLNKGQEIKDLSSPSNYTAQKVVKVNRDGSADTELSGDEVITDNQTYRVYYTATTGTSDESVQMFDYQVKGYPNTNDIVGQFKFEFVPDSKGVNGNHPATVTGNTVEQYKLKVTFIPKTSAERNTILADAGKTIDTPQTEEKTINDSKLKEITVPKGGKIVIDQSVEGIYKVNVFAIYKQSTSVNPTTNEHPKLAGAKFSLTGTKSKNVYYGLSDDTGLVKWYADENCSTPILFNKWVTDSYTFKEIKAPEGYSLNPTQWTITKTSGTNIVSKVEITGEDSTPTNCTYYFNNTPLYSLPSTGGTGIYLYMIGGMMLMLIAVWILYKNKCREVLER